jgi:plasmid maintenance system antidote protein VapI
VPPRRINEIVHAKRGISADTASRLSRALGLSNMFWINMQAHYDAEIAREHIGSELATIQRISVSRGWLVHWSQRWSRRGYPLC